MRYEIWMKANVPQRQRSVRFVESMEIVFISRVVHNVEVNVKGDGRGPLTLLPNQPFPPYVYNATEPRTWIIEYAFRSPQMTPRQVIAGVPDSDSSSEASKHGGAQ